LPGAADKIKGDVRRKHSDRVTTRNQNPDQLGNGTKAENLELDPGQKHVGGKSEESILGAGGGS